MSKRWANKMRFIYISIFILIILALSASSIYKFLNPPLTCFDGIQNQGETAVDLGGPCRYLNPADLKPLLNKWARSFMVVPGLYSSVAYVENPNTRGGIRNIKYTFKLYDEDNIIITERSGETFIPPSKVVPIFEGNLQTGKRVPKRTIFEFTQRPVWEKMKSDLIAEVSVAEKEFKIANGLPRLSAKIQNRGVYSLHNLVVVATLFDRAGNAVGASRTVIDLLPPDSDRKIVFTWPKSLGTFVSRVDIVPLLPPVDSL